MIRFIDLTTGNVFNGDKPYVFWFDKEQSVNLFYVRKICVVSKYDHIHIEMPQNNVFHFLDTDNMGGDLEKAGMVFKDLGHKGFQCFSLDQQGVKYKGMYVYMIYVLGHSSDSGEFREEFTITGTSADGTVEVGSYCIGADFYNEMENLGIQLGNEGVEIPKAVQKAIYDSNIHEDGADNILMNRKNKELLSEYINTIGNKGSYKSLINSLNWFEYGDLVKILEHWSHGEPAKGEYLSQHDLQKLVNSHIYNLLTKQHKTTYIGLYLALQKTEIDANGDLTYVSGVKYFEDEANQRVYGGEWNSAKTEKLLIDDFEVLITDPKDRLLQVGEDQILVDQYPVPFIDKTDPAEKKRGSNWMLLEKWYDEEGHIITREIPEPIPALSAVASKWSAIDLSLKMTLLGDFFKTYFMPIHLDLIHSTIENIVYTNTYKIFSWSRIQRTDYNHDIESFSCSVKDGDKFYVGDVKARVYPDTTFGSQYDATTKDLDIFGVDIEDRDTHVSKIFSGSNGFDRASANDKIIPSSSYYGWGSDIYTKQESPVVGDITYSLTDGKFDEVGTVESIVITSIYDNQDLSFERNPGLDVTYGGLSYIGWGENRLTDPDVQISGTIYELIDDIPVKISAIKRITVGEINTYIRNSTIDQTIPETKYYAWVDSNSIFYTLLENPRIGDCLYEYDEGASYMQESGLVIGDETTDGGWAPGETEGPLKTFGEQRFEGPGAIVPFNVVLHRTQRGMYITEGTILIYHKGKTEVHKSYNIYNDPDEVAVGGDRHISFNILLRDAGDYKFVIDFRCGNDKHYVKTVDFVVSDDIAQSVKMYRVRRRSFKDILSMFGETPVNREDMVKHMFTQLDKSNVIYKQFITTSENAVRQKVGLNEFFLYEPKVSFEGADVKVEMGLKIDLTTDTGTKKEFSFSIDPDRGLIDPSTGELKSSTTQSRLNKFIRNLNAYSGTNNHKMFFVQPRASLRVDKILDDYSSKYEERIKIYRFKHDLGQLWGILLEESAAGVDVSSYYVLVPYIIGIDPQFKITNENQVICKNKQVGIVRNGNKYACTFNVYMNAYSRKVTIEITSGNVLQYNFDKGRYPFMYKYIENSQYNFSPATRVVEKTKLFEVKTGDYIINNKLTLRVYFAADLYKEIVIDVPEQFADTSVIKYVKSSESVSCYGMASSETEPDILNPKPVWKYSTEHGRFWDSYRFIPLFHELEEVPSRVVEHDDVVCFLPDINMIKRSSIQDVGWSFKNTTTGEVINPIVFSPTNKKEAVVPLQPMLGRFDLRKIIDPGYYDVTLKFELVDSCNKKHTYTSKSDFIIKK